MKKQISFIAIILFLVMAFEPSVYSQSFTVGGKIGMGFSTYSNWDERNGGDDNFKRSPLTGLQISLIGKYKFNDLLGLQAELQFITKGERYTDEQNLNNVSTTYKRKRYVNYLTLPVLVNVTHSFNAILVYGNFGPYFGLGLTGKSIVTEPVKGGGKEVVFKQGESRRFDMGLCLGAGVGYRLGPGNLMLDFRYDLGFVDIYSTADEDKGTNYKATCNRTFGIAIGYLIPLGKK